MLLTEFKAGSWRKGFEYKYFLPESIDHEFIINDSKSQELLEKASIKLGELNSFAKLVPEIDLFIRSYVMKEAVTSSRIEGTRTDIEEAFSDELDINPEHRDDWTEVNRYVQAMNYALEKLERLPLSNRLIKDTHKILLSHVRGKAKSPGTFRRSQNWLGGASIKTAAFIPPSQEHVAELMSDWEKFLHNTEINVPHLIKIAVAHYQFETIHPFLDGNGRLGRLLITLYLVSQKVLQRPLLYTSDFFERHKSLYYDNLTLVREKNDLKSWVQFFLVAVAETAENAVDTLQEIMLLKENLLNSQIPALGKRTKSANLLLNLLFSRPVINVQTIEKEIGLSKPAANNLVRDFLRLKILTETTGQKRNRQFAFGPYLKLLSRE